MEDDRLLGIAEVMGLLTKLSAGLTLRMWRKGILPPEEAGDFAEILRELAKIYELGDEKVATELWTAANLLQRPPPKDRE